MTIFVNLLNKLTNKEVDLGIVINQVEIIQHQDKVLLYMFVKFIDDRRHHLIQRPLPDRHILQGGQRRLTKRRKFLLKRRDKMTTEAVSVTVKCIQRIPTNGQFNVVREVHQEKSFAISGRCD